MNATLRKFTGLDSPLKTRNASVSWKGNLREGAGTMSTESGVLSETPYSFQTRFNVGSGTNPDELVAAALSGCFSMALVNELGLSGFHPKRIDTAGSATMEDLPAGWTMTRIHLKVHAEIPDISEADFLAAATSARMNCPISRALNMMISLEATLN